MSPLVAVGVILLLAWMVEGLVETVLGTPFERIARLQPYKWVLMYAAFGVGILGAFVYKLDILFLLMWYLDPATNGQATIYGLVLTGLAIGRGSNYIHDLVKRFKESGQAATGPGV